MTDVAAWPITTAQYHANSIAGSVKVTPMIFGDPLDLPELQPLVFPRPLTDKALMDHDDREME